MRRYQFIDQQREHYPLHDLVHTLEVSRSGFYAWHKRPLSPRAQRHQQLARTVAQTYHQFEGIYGSRKITRELLESKINICRNTVDKLMREMNLQSKAQKRRAFVLTTDSQHPEPIAENHLAQDFTARRPDEKWVADITYVPTDQGWAYMAAVMDLYSRRIVGWAVSDSLESDLVLEALEQAIQTRSPKPGELMYHSDRGVQYASRAHRGRLAELGITCSMSRRGNCWDNACMERFMNAYKNEWTHHRHYTDVQAVRQSTFKYIEIFYNRQRRHQALNYLSPAAFEARYRENNAA